MPYFKKEFVIFFFPYQVIGFFIVIDCQLLDLSFYAVIYLYLLDAAVDNDVIATGSISIVVALYCLIFDPASNSLLGREIAVGGPTSAAVGATLLGMAAAASMGGRHGY
jgi:hypothetical protein